MVGRRNAATLGLSALLAVTGCHAGTSGNLNRSTAPPAARQEVAVTRIIALHNKNAASIRSIQAFPTIHVVGTGMSGKVSGKLALDRPKDFRLTLNTMSKPQADIGSNAEGFWFWMADDAEKKIYTCRHDQMNASPLAITLQPDWIVEAMGLREFPPEEIRTISSKPEGRPGYVLLTQFRKDSRGQAMTKETVIEESTGQIREHRLYSGAKKDLLASAVITKYLVKDLAEPSAADPDNPDAPASSTTRVKLPSRVRLSWVKEKFELDIVMPDSTRFNPQFPAEQRTALFTEPEIPGIARQDLAALGSSRLYESSPRSGIGLGQPEPAPIDIEGSYQKPADPRPLASNIRRSTAPPPRTPAPGVVRAPIPNGGGDPEAQQAGGSNLLMAPPRDQ